MILRFIFTICFLIIGAASAYSASIELVEEQTYIIPDISVIKDFRFADIESDGKPEILVREMTHLVFYAPESDSVLWEYDLEPAMLYGILAADITRDSVVDIVVGCYNQEGLEFYDSAVTIDIFDGAAGWDMTRHYHPTVKYSSYWGEYFSYHPYGGFTIFDAYDVNGDGYNEFLVSYGNKVSETHTGGLEFLETINGRTWMYFQYPDSIQWQYGMLCDSARPINSEYSNMLTANNQYYFSHTGHGPDYLTSCQNLILLDQDGAADILTHPLETVDYEKTLYETENISSITVLASGFIDSDNDNSDLLVRYYWNSFNNINGSSSSGLNIRLYNLISPDSCELRWTKGNEGLDKYVCLPDFPGVYFAFGNDSLKMFSGDNGDILDAASGMPDNIYGWVIMPDNSVRLITVSGNIIKTHSVEAVTGTGDDPTVALPSFLSLGQPYPNPFNATQTIPVNIKPGKRLTIDVYNLLGQKIDRIYSGVSYSKTLNITWNADKYASGIYLIRAQSGDQSFVVKSILLK